MTVDDTDDRPPDPTIRWLTRTSLTVGVSLVLFTLFALLVLSSRSDDAEVIGAARLTWDERTDDPLGEGKSASAEIIEEGGRFRVFVFDLEVLRPPADFEFIQAWLVERDESGEARREPIGRIDEIRTRLFPLDDDLDPTGFDVIEFSLEPDGRDENDYSGRTLMDGEIVWLVDPPG